MKARNEQVPTRKTLPKQPSCTLFTRRAAPLRNAAVPGDTSLSRRGKVGWYSPDSNVRRARDTTHLETQRKAMIPWNSTGQYSFNLMATEVGCTLSQSASVFDWTIQVSIITNVMFLEQKVTVRHCTKIMSKLCSSYTLSVRQLWMLFHLSGIQCW